MGQLVDTGSGATSGNQCLGWSGPLTCSVRVQIAGVQPTLSAALATCGVMPFALNANQHFGHLHFSSQSSRFNHFLDRSTPAVGF
jgi:hypothetical protein